MKQAIILAGGLGTRLKARLGDLPKPMIPIGDKPLLEIQVLLAKKHGFTDLVIFACYRADLIESYFGDGARWGVRIRYVIEQTPLGTAGAVLDRFDILESRFLVLYGDTMINVDLDRFWRAHEKAGADASLLLHPNDHPLDSDLVEIDGNNRITAFHGRPHLEGRWFQNLVNAGLYVLEKEPLKKFLIQDGESSSPHPSPLRGKEREENPHRAESSTGEPTTGAFIPSPPPGERARERWLSPGRSLDFGKDVFPMMLGRGCRLHGYNSPEYIKDIGTPGRYDRIIAEWKSGLVENSSLEHEQKAVFVDRDGTLIHDADNLRRVEDLVLLPGAAEAVHLLNHHGFRVVVVTNQPVIAKGFCTESTLSEIHKKMETLLGQGHAFLDRIYYCPHHPEKGFEGEISGLKIDCACRKPKTGMLEKARRELNIDFAKSWLVGDTTVDMETAKNAGIKSVLVKTGAGGTDARFNAAPGEVCKDILAAARFIVGRSGGENFS